MKQLFLKSLLWTIQTTTKGIVAFIHFCTGKPGASTSAPFADGRSGIYTSDGTHLDDRLDAMDAKIAEATQARDQAVTELSVEAQAVVDRIQERTVRLIPNDPPATIKVKAPRKPRATKIIEVDGVPTIVPARPRKPKGGDQ